MIYKPHSSALKYHRLRYNEPHIKEILILAAIRSGKSYSLRYEIIKAANNNPTDDPVLVAMPTYRMVRIVHMQEIISMLKRMGLHSRHSFSESEVYLRNGKCIQFRGLDDPDNAVRSMAYYEAFVDECAYCTQYAVDVIKTRLLTTNGRLNMVTTPKGVNNWVYQRYFSEEGVRNRPDYFKHIYYRLRDNPTITDEAEARLRASLDPKLAEQELDARFVNLRSQTVYYAFADQNIGRFTYDQNKPVYIGIDYNVGIMAWVALQAVGAKSYAVVKEGCGSHDVKSVADDLLALFGSSAIIIDDASGRNRNQGDGATNRQILRAKGLKKISSLKSNPMIDRRVSTVNALCNDAQNRRRLFVDRNCSNLSGELRTLSYKEKTGKIDSMGGSMGHITDALGYALMFLTRGQILGWDERSPHERAKEFERR